VIQFVFIIYFIIINPVGWVLFDFVIIGIGLTVVYLIAKQKGIEFSLKSFYKIFIFISVFCFLFIIIFTTIYLLGSITFDLLVRNISVFIGLHMMVAPLMIIASRQVEIEIPYGKIKKALEWFTSITGSIQAIMWIIEYLKSLI
jgi:hypothetical protein